MISTGKNKQESTGAQNKITASSASQIMIKHTATNSSDRKNDFASHLSQIDATSPLPKHFPCIMEEHPQDQQEQAKPKQSRIWGVPLVSLSSLLIAQINIDTETWPRSLRVYVSQVCGDVSMSSIELIWKCYLLLQCRWRQ
jgi:hypothetical protein